MKPFNYNSPRWKRVKEEAKRRAGYRCQVSESGRVCGRTEEQLKAVGEYLCVHHRLDPDFFTEPKYRYGYQYLLMCCIEHHERIHGRPFVSRCGRLPPPLEPPIQQVELELDEQTPELIAEMGISVELCAIGFSVEAERQFFIDMRATRLRDAILLEQRDERQLRFDFENVDKAIDEGKDGTPAAKTTGPEGRGST